jgi:hypothetical protein
MYQEIGDQGFVIQFVLKIVISKLRIPISQYEFDISLSFIITVHLKHYLKVFATYVLLNFNHSFSRNESQRHFEFIGDEKFFFLNFIKCKDSKIPKFFILKVKKLSSVSTRDMDSDCCMSKY